MLNIYLRVQYIGGKNLFIQLFVIYLSNIYVERVEYLQCYYILYQEKEVWFVLFLVDKKENNYFDFYFIKDFVDEEIRIDYVICNKYF